MSQLADYLKKRFDLAEGLYENIFFTYHDQVIADGLGGTSVGYVMDHELEAYHYRQLENPGVDTGEYMYSPITGRPAIPIINSIMDQEHKQVISTFCYCGGCESLNTTIIVWKRDRWRQNHDS